MRGLKHYTGYQDLKQYITTPRPTQKNKIK
jgi:hypothetical protein